ncbi:MAG: NAD(P)H-dependent oxidoreductase [Bacilli bacterium]|nr:NAD(P)H-dependent oxidoreductase [Bacilli bacterium]
MKDKKSLIIYFSRADENYAVGIIEKGNTEVVAEYIRDITGAEMFKVEPLMPYAHDYETCIEEAKTRQANHNAPIKEEVSDITNYEVIYIGAPVYWGDLPEEMVTALKDINFNGKTIRPFTTHEGSGLGNIPNQLRRICVGANVLDGLAIRGASVANSKVRVEDWV